MEVNHCPAFCPGLHNGHGALGFRKGMSPRLYFRRHFIAFTPSLGRSKITVLRKGVAFVPLVKKLRNRVPLREEKAGKAWQGKGALSL